VQSNWEYVDDHPKGVEEIASVERGGEEHSDECIRLLIKESAIPKDALSALVSESEDSSIRCWLNSISREHDFNERLPT